MKFLHKLLLLLIVPVSLFYLLEVWDSVGIRFFDEHFAAHLLGEREALTLSERHYLTFPVLLLVLVQVFFSGKYALLGSVLIFLPCLFWGVQDALWSAVPKSDTAVMLARLTKDPKESFTLRLQEQIHRFLPAHVRGVIGPDSKAIRTHKAALKRYPAAPAVIWGDGERVRVSFHESATSVARFVLGEPTPSVELHFIQNVPGIELSFEPIQQTGMFLAGLVSVVESLRTSRMNEISKVEDRLLALGLHESAWSNFAHLALPWFYLGNLYVEQVYESDGESSLQRCALDAYTEAAARVQPKVHPLLRASIFNNKAVALMMQRELLTKERSVEIRSLLRGANMMASQPTKGWRPRKYIRGAIRRNLLALKRLKQPGAKRNKKQREGEKNGET